MTSVTSYLSSMFWNEYIWLPPSVTWDSFSQSQAVNSSTVYPDQFAQFSHLLYPLPMALVVIVLRWMVEKLVFKQVGIRMGIKHNKRPYPEQNTILEKAFRRLKSPGPKDMKIISGD